MELSKCLGCMEDLQGYPCPHCGYDPVKEKRPEYALPQETILAGKYLVGRVLGQGGFGITYIGWDLALERKVAIKEYYPSGQVSRIPGTVSLIWSASRQTQSTKDDGMDMFLKEARKMEKVRHISSVVQVLDIFQENDTAYIIMDYADGCTLKSYLSQNGPMSWDYAAPLFRQVIHTMQEVHKAGLVHRDLSPDNIMLSDNSQIKILDLGAAKDLNVNHGVSSMQVAKSGFSPLEQYIERGNSGTWTDVYSLAATIYYTLTGKLLPSAVDRLNEDSILWDLPGLSALPKYAIAGLKNALAVQPKDRTQTMNILENELFYKHKVKLKTGYRKNRVWIALPVIAGVLCAVIAYKWLSIHTQAYQQAQSLLASEQYGDAAEAFAALGNYRDSKQMAENAQELQTEREEQEASAALEAAYTAAQELLDAKQYTEAINAFDALGDYKDSSLKSKEADALRQEAYAQASSWMDAKRYPAAAVAFTALGDYKDSIQQATRARKQFQVMPIAAGSFNTSYMRSDGSIVAEGYSLIGRFDTNDWENIVSVAVGGSHIAALCQDGTVKAIATSYEDHYGQCAVESWTDIIAISAGGLHTVGLCNDGTVKAVGSYEDAQCDVRSWTDIVEVSAGGCHTVGLCSNGTVVATGLNDGRCNVESWKNIISIAAGSDFTAGLCYDGTVVIAASITSLLDPEDVIDWSNIVAISAGDDFLVGLHSDGTVVAAGWNYKGSYDDVCNWTDVIAVAAGGSHILGLHSDGTVIANKCTHYKECNPSKWKNIYVP